MTLRPALILFTAYSLFLHAFALFILHDRFDSPYSPPPRVGTPLHAGIIWMETSEMQGEALAAAETSNATESIRRPGGGPRRGGLAERAASMQLTPPRVSMSAAAARKPQTTRTPGERTADRAPPVEGTSQESIGQLGMTSDNATSNHADATLARIYTRLSRARYYPPAARLRHYEGSPVVQFRIRPDGSITELAVHTSCGIPTLDSAALQTVRRATPLPYTPQRLIVPIRYKLYQP